MEQMRKVIGTNSYVGTSQTYNSNQAKTFGTGFRIIGKNDKQTSKMNTLGKIRVICFFSVMALLAFLYIYNFIAMATLQSNISSIESSIQSEQNAVVSLKKQLNEATSESAIMERVSMAGYSENAQMSGDLLVVQVPETEIVSVEPQTNWFNDLCLFISSIFGG